MTGVRRRQLLAVGGVGLPLTLGGCVQAPDGGDGADGDGIPIRVTERADQPAGPVTYDVEMVEPVATDARPARLRVSIANPTGQPVVLGEERAVKFHHGESDARRIYLYPAGEAPWEGPVEPGCWQLTESVPVPEYYGTVSLRAGETVRAASYVYGHPELPTGTCLPAGEHRIRTSGLVGDEEAAVLAGGSTATEFEWGFSLRVGP